MYCHSRKRVFPLNGCFALLPTKSLICNHVLTFFHQWQFQSTDWSHIRLYSFSDKGIDHFSKKHVRTSIRCPWGNLNTWVYQWCFITSGRAAYQDAKMFIARSHVKCYIRVAYLDSKLRRYLTDGILQNKHLLISELFSSYKYIEVQLIYNF